MIDLLLPQEAAERQCWFPDGCKSEKECQHRAQCASQNLLPSSNGQFMQHVLQDVPADLFKPREIDFPAWIKLGNMDNPIGFSND